MGAWTTYYRRGTVGGEDPVGWACLAVKRELAFCGFKGKMVLSSPLIGQAADLQIRAFQIAQGLESDGVVGPLTARKLFRKRTAQVEGLHSIPGRLLEGLVALESAYDPGAVGVADPDDKGIVQVNLRAHPQVSAAQAFDPSWAIPWAGTSLASAYGQLHDWDAAIASWNVGVGGAQNWLQAGKPKAGGPEWFPGLYERATRYVELVKSKS